MLTLKNLEFLKPVVSLAMLLLMAAGCSNPQKEEAEKKAQTEKNTASVQATVLQPAVVTDTTRHDTDDPAIWINPNDPAKSLVIGTDKDADGALYVFDLDGNTVQVVDDLQRPNNVDVEYGLSVGGESVDIAVAAERLTHKLRIFRLPDMQPIDGGGIEIFKGETGAEFRDLMGIAMYKRPSDGQVFAVAGRKNGPTDGTYLWQYALKDDGNGQVTAELVRKFGQFSGNGEIEAIAVDDALGYVYYSDEAFGIRKYHADPKKGDEELAAFGKEGFTEDREGISLYTFDDGTGYILVSDQQADQFHIFPREGTEGNPHNHPLLKTVKVSTTESDGSETVAVPLGSQFPHGLFVAMSDNKTFQYYPWETIAGEDLKMVNAPAVSRNP